MEWVNQHDDLEKEPTIVLLAANNYSRKAAEHYRSPQIKIYTIFKQIPQVILPPEIDYYISTTRYGLQKNFPKTPVVHTIGRNGGVFAVIKTKHKVDTHSYGFKEFDRLSQVSREKDEARKLVVQAE